MNLQSYIENVIFVFCILYYIRLASSEDKNLLKLLNDCAKINCKCTTNYEEDTIEFPANDPQTKIQLNKMDPDLLLIKCYKPINNDFLKIIPNLNIETKKDLTVIDCVLSYNLSISSVLKKMAITNYKYLTIKAEKIEINITKQYLGGLYGLKYLRYIANGNETSVMPEDLFSHESLRNLTSVSLNPRNCKLSKNIFYNLQNLENLVISGLNSIPKGIFRNKRKLEFLSIKNCSLENVTKYVFEPLNQLKYFHLDKSIIEGMEPDAFELLKNVELITLMSNNIHSLPIFKNNRFLEELLINNDGTHIQNIPLKMLANLPHLKEVRIQQCGLKTIPEDLFVNSTNIKLIDLSNNSLEFLPDKLLETQHNLAELNFSYNNLQFLPYKFLSVAIKLEKIILSNNKLSKFSGFDLNRYFFLMELHLQNNNLTDENLPLKKIYINYLDISNNNIQNISQYLPVTDKTLKAASNSITSLNASEICSLLKQYDMEIDVSFNQIHTINFNNLEKCITPLKRIIVNNNPLHCECSTTMHLRYFLIREKHPQLLKRLQFEAHNASCESPFYLKGMNLANYDPMKIACDLDGPKCPRECICSIRLHDKVLIVNCSNSLLISIPDLPAVEALNLTGIELFFENNKLKELPLNDTHGYANVTKLFLAGNYLENIDQSQLPTNLQYLDIRKNRFKILDKNTIRLLNASKNSLQVYLSDNPWICDCDKKEMINVIQINTLMFVDSSKMECDNKPKYKYLNYLQDVCSNQQIFYITLASILFGIFLILATLIALYYKYQEEIKVWLYAHNMCLWFVTENELDRNRLYDAFISYSSKDEDFIYDHLIPELENGLPPFKLCVYDRDWLIGACIPDAIVYSITNSKRTIVVLSKNFIESVWAKMEFKTAHRSALNEGRSRLIVIIYGDIGDIDSLDKELKVYLTMNIYLKWGEPNFWNKLRYAMPHTFRIRNDQENIPLREYINKMLE